MDVLQKRAVEAEEAGDLPLALELWKERSQREDEDGISFLKFGRIAQKLEMWDESEVALTQALRLLPDFYLVKVFMGMLWLNRTDKARTVSLQNAKEWFLDAVNNKKNAATLSLLGAAHTRLDEIAAARNAFEEAIKIDPNYEEALYNLAVIEERTDLQKARELLERAIQIDPDYKLAMYKFAEIEEETDPHKARELLERTIQIDFDYAQAHQTLGRICQKMKELVRAEYHFRRCLEIDPADYWSNLYLANLLGVTKRNDEAEQTYRLATDLRPDLAGGFEFFARFLESTGKLKEAAEERAKIKPSARAIDTLL